MNFKDLNITIRKTRVTDYYAVDIRVRVDGREIEVNELLPNTDFYSRWRQILDLVDKEVMRAVTEGEDI